MDDKEHTAPDGSSLPEGVLEFRARRFGKHTSRREPLAGQAAVGHFTALAKTGKTPRILLVVSDTERGQEIGKYLEAHGAGYEVLSQFGPFDRDLLRAAHDTFNHPHQHTAKPISLIVIEDDALKTEHPLPVEKAIASGCTGKIPVLLLTDKPSRFEWLRENSLKPAASIGRLETIDTARVSGLEDQKSMIAVRAAQMLQHPDRQMRSR